MATPAPSSNSLYGNTATGPTSVYMVEPRPTGASTLVMVGAFFVLAEGILYVVSGPFYLSDGLGPLGGALALDGVLDAIIGVLLFGAALLVVAEPHHHLANGLLVLLLVGLSFLFGFGGFFIGGLLAAIGAIWSMAWKPTGSDMLVTITPVANPPPKS